MTIKQFIKKLEESAETLLTEVGTELTDYAREKSYYCILGAIDYLKENEEGICD
jgi:hypothetical protein